MTIAESTQLVSTAKNADILNALISFRSEIVDRLAVLDKNNTERMARFETSQQDMSRRLTSMELKIDKVQEAQAQQQAQQSVAQEAIGELKAQDKTHDDLIKELRQEIKELRKDLEETNRRVWMLMGGATVAGAVLGQLAQMLFEVILR